MGNMEEELDRRQTLNNTMRRVILGDLQELIHEHNALVRLFKTALQRTQSDEYKILIRADKRPAGTHERQFNAPTIDEIAVVIVGENCESRDIVQFWAITTNIRNTPFIRRITIPTDILARRRWILYQH